MARQNSDVLSQVERLKDMLTSEACGARSDDADYRKLRADLRSNPYVSQRLPQCVHECRTLREFWLFIQPKFGKYREREQYLASEFEPLLSLLEQDVATPIATDLVETLRQIGAGFIHDSWQKALDRCPTDPAGAVTAARSLLETVCKFILDESRAPYALKDDLQALYYRAIQQVNLGPNQRSEQAMKVILGGCLNTVNGLAALRNSVGDAHGKGLLDANAAVTHATLAVNLAGAISQFLLSTWQEQHPPILRASAETIDDLSDVPF